MAGLHLAAQQEDLSDVWLRQIRENRDVASVSASMPPRSHHLDLTHEELRALVIAVDHAVYPGPDGTPVGVAQYRQLTVLHERLWEELAARSPEQIADAMVRSNDG